MEDKFVYVVECSSGSWDSFHWWIGGIFSDLGLAENLMDRLNAEAERVKNSCPVRGDVDNMSKDEEDMYWSYFIANGRYMEWNLAVVKEYPLNKWINESPDWVAL